MKLSSRDRRALILLAIAVAVMLIWRFAGTTDAPVEAAVNSTELLERQLARLRLTAATVPGKEKLAQRLTSELATLEKGMIQADTAPQAQAQLLQVVRQIAKTESIDARGGEFGPARPLGQDYGEVSVTVAFECRIEQLVNLLAALSSVPDLLATSEIQINASSNKEKTIGVRLGVSGVVPRKLVPDKKGAAL
ncbi:MAG: type II secretion system protein GspM [Bryobacteraceae bacterium]